VSAARVLDDATSLAARRPASLLICAAVGYLPLYLAALAFEALVLSGDRPPRLELLALGGGGAGAWLCSCWTLSAAMRVCAGELRGERVSLARALRRGIADLPRVVIASSARMFLCALALAPLGAALPYARVLTGGLLPAAVLDGEGLRAGLALSRRAAGSFAAGHALAWGLTPLVWANLALAAVALSELFTSAQRLGAGTARGQLVLALTSATLTLILVEPFRIGGLVAAWETDRRVRLGGDLLRRAGR